MLIYANLNEATADALCLELNGIRCDSLLKAAVLIEGESIEGFSQDKLYDYLAYIGGDVLSNFTEKLNEAVNYISSKEDSSCSQNLIDT